MPTTRWIRSRTDGNTFAALLLAPLSLPDTQRMSLAVSQRFLIENLVQILSLNIPEQACHRALAVSPCCWIVGNVAHELFLGLCCDAYSMAAEQRDGLQGGIS